jgi:hypothetical protein
MEEKDTSYEETKEEEKKNILGKRKKQILSRLHTDENIKTIKTSKKPLRKLWILIILFVAIALIAGYNPGGIIPGYEPSWAYVNYDVEKFGMTRTIEDNFQSDWTASDLDYSWNELWFTTPASAFGTALFKEDFSETSVTALYGLISLLILGVAVIIFEKIDKKRDYSITKFTTIQCILYSAMIIPTVLILTSLLKFVGSYILIGHQYYRTPLTVRLGEVEVTRFNTWIYPVPYLLIVISFMIIAIIFTVMETDLRVILREQEKDNTYKKSSSNSKLWG